MVVLSTKVSTEAYGLVNSLCKRLGITVYDLLQMFADVSIRMMDDRHNLSYEMERMMQVMDGMKDWKTSIRLTDPEQKMRIAEAFYAMTETGRTGTRVVHIQGGTDDLLRTETFNVQSIVERFMELAMPEVYKRLRLIGGDLNTNSVYETLCRIVDEYKIDPNAEELRLTFADNDRSEQGRKPFDGPTKRTRTNHPELFQ